MEYLKSFLGLERKEQVSVVLLGVAALFLLTALLKLVIPASAPFDGEEMVANLKKAATPNPANVKQTIELNRKRATEIEAQNYFFPKPKPPPPTIMAIMGEEALINGQWLKVGSHFNGNKIKAISPDSVVLEEAGKERTLYVNGFTQESQKSRWTQQESSLVEGDGLVIEMNEMNE